MIFMIAAVVVRMRSMGHDGPKIAIPAMRLMAQVAVAIPMIRRVVCVMPVTLSGVLGDHKY